MPKALVDTQSIFFMIPRQHPKVGTCLVQTVKLKKGVHRRYTRQKHVKQRANNIRMSTIAVLVIQKLVDIQVHGHYC